MKNLTAKCKVCRREGAKLFLRGDRCNSAKCAIVKRNFPPGIHGQAGSRPTDYGKQLREKQKAKRTYGIIERQMKNYYTKAVNLKGDTGPHLVKFLEMRLDTIVYRAGFCVSMTQARQLVNHGHFTVNGKKVTIPSYQVKVNDVIALRAKSSKQKAFESLAEKMKTYRAPEWIFFDVKDMTAKVIDEPILEKLSLPYDIKQIIEFYSR
jgi:small subunit ribosomal protein S4